ncbi:MAG: signal peptidase I [Clostridiales bacterium]|jgi:signal peptidase I|nr:signal peptidase I [Clostridiales bacterium]
MQEADKQEIIKEVISWTKTIVAAVVFALCITQFVIVNAKVPTGSMMDNIMPNDRIVAFRLSYINSEPERFDIVVFYFPDDRKDLYVKRVIGLPGETVTIRAGKVYINDDPVPLDDSFVRTKPYEEDFGPVTVPEDSYFMMGDNRNNSADSRVWINKYVVKKDILGKVLFRYFPNFRILYNT